LPYPFDPLSRLNPLIIISNLVYINTPLLPHVSPRANVRVEYVR
jgi:hypothetical protein